jgi:hypothetical protein
VDKSVQLNQWCIDCVVLQIFSGTQWGQSVDATFADDPAAYFHDNGYAAHHLPRARMEELQLEALQTRFATLRDNIPPLTALADAQGIHALNRLEDALPILFPHQIYKSYPEHLLQRHLFTALTNWLQLLTLNDLSGVAAKHFTTLDAWLVALDRETDLHIIHSSGTTGRLSFYPRGKHENELQTRHSRMTLAEMVDPMDFEASDLRFTMIWPSYATGKSAILRAADMFRQSFATTPADFHPLFDAEMSSDWQYFVMRAENNRKLGSPSAEMPSDYVRAKIDQVNGFHRCHAECTSALLARIREDLSGKNLMLTGGPLSLYRFAADGHARGMTTAFSSGSIVASFGGMKGFAAPSQMDATIKRFSGVPKILENYGMTELSTGMSLCRAGRYHVPPWVIPYVLDPLSGALLVRQGRQKGRAAFVDLAARTYWGGIVTADVVEMDWAQCVCGRTTPHIGRDVERSSADVENAEMLWPVSASAMLALNAAMRC